MANKPFIDGRGNAYTAVAVAPNDSTDLTNPGAALYVGTGGNIKVNMADNTTITFNNVQDGTVLPILVNRVHSTDTTATNIIALY